MDRPAVGVFASSALDVAPHYREMADQMGTRIGARDWTLVYGGTLTGMMRSVADSCRAAGGRVVAVTMQRFVDLGIHDDDADELIVCDTLAERKAELLARADAHVALPGGLGTFDEIGDALALPRLGGPSKAMVLLDHGGYWTPMLGQFEVMLREGMLGQGDGSVPTGHSWDTATDPAGVEAFLVHHFAGD